MTSISLVLCVLLFSSFLSSYAEFVTQDSAFPGVFGQTFWLSQEPPTICPTLGKPPRADLCLPCICPHPTPLQEQPVGDLLLALWLKTGLNWNVSAYMDTNMLQGLLSSWRATLNDVPKLTGKLAIRLWASALWQICSWTWYCIANHFWTVAIVVCLYLLTACMATMVRYLFGGLLGYLLRICGASVIKGVWSCYTRAKSSSSYVKEKAVKGFLSFRIPQKPPRSSVLLVQHNDDSHAGYATNVLLYNGEFCLLTAEHVWKTPGARVVSTQNGSKIPISEFQLLMSVDGGDLVVLRGPPNWTSVLQTKAVSFTTSARLERGKVTLYSYNGEWSATNGEVVGTEGIFATHLSNTTGGHSGTPLFHGKTVVGIHIGASNENWNLAAVIPAVAGLTSPDYVFETTAPQGKVFDEATVEMISERIKLAEYLINYKPKSGKAWADEDDDMFYDPESAPPNPLPQPVPSAPTLPSGATTPTGPANGLYPTIDVGAVPVLLGNGLGGANRQNKAKPSAIPPEPENVGKNVLEQVVKELVKKVSTSSIEKEVARQVASNIKKQQPPSQEQRRPRRQRASKNTSEPSTAGKYLPPHQRSQASKAAAPSPVSTTLNKKVDPRGEKPSASNTQNWRKKQEALGGPSSARKLN
ncbi:P1 protein [Cotton bunchy top virus 1]|nr:P1 protein [Cotton bunchy top virus 1]